MRQPDFKLPALRYDYGLPPRFDPSAALFSSRLTPSLISMNYMICNSKSASLPLKHLSHGEAEKRLKEVSELFAFFPLSPTLFHKKFYLMMYQAAMEKKDLRKKAFTNFSQFFGLLMAPANDSDSPRPLPHHQTLDQKCQILLHKIEDSPRRVSLNGISIDLSRIVNRDQASPARPPQVMFPRSPVKADVPVKFDAGNARKASSLEKRQAIRSSIALPKFACSNKNLKKYVKSSNMNPSVSTTARKILQFPSGKAKSVSINKTVKTHEKFMRYPTSEVVYADIGAKFEEVFNDQVNINQLEKLNRKFEENFPAKKNGVENAASNCFSKPVEKTCQFALSQPKDSCKFNFLKKGRNYLKPGTTVFHKETNLTSSLPKFHTTPRSFQAKPIYGHRPPDSLQSNLKSESKVSNQKVSITEGSMTRFQPNVYCFKKNHPPKCFTRTLKDEISKGKILSSNNFKL